MGEMSERLLSSGFWAHGRLRKAALADGDAGAAVEQFEAAAGGNISKLAGALPDDTFEPQPVVRVAVAKPGGGTRKLAVPSLRDRIVERALLVELDAVIDPPAAAMELR